MSDEEDITESESGDFSASEDDWVPDKKRKPSTASSTISSDDDEEEEASSADNRNKQKKATSRKKPIPRPTVPKSVPKPKTNVPRKAVPKRTGDDDESSSSGDDCLVDPSKLDLNSDFFAASTSGSTSVRPPPVWNPKAKLSDLSDDDDDDLVEPTAVRSFEQNEQFIKSLEQAKALLEAATAANPSASPTAALRAGPIDIGQLLQMGESKPRPAATHAAAAPSTSRSSATATKKRPAAAAAAGPHSDHSDWEEVADTAPRRPDEVVTTIHFGQPLQPKPNRTQLELEAQLKRALNRRKKETQLLMHQVHVLCWIGHGNHVNRVLNDPRLMRQCLQFMPSTYTYPKERTDRTYVEQIARWYGSQMRLARGAAAEAPLSRLPALPVSLALQMRAREAISRRAFVLMFVVLLRAIGVQCRLVMNLVTVPLRPAASELCPVKVETAAAAAAAKKKDGTSKPVKRESAAQASDAKGKVVKATPIRPDASAAKQRTADVKPARAGVKASPIRPDASAAKQRTADVKPARAAAKSEPPIVSPHFAAATEQRVGRVTASKSKKTEPQFGAVVADPQTAKDAKRASKTPKVSAQNPACSAAVVSPHFAAAATEQRAGRASASKHTKAEPQTAKADAKRPSASETREVSTSTASATKSTKASSSKPATVSPHFAEAKSTAARAVRSKVDAKSTETRPPPVLTAKKRPHLSGASGDPVPASPTARFAQSNAANIGNSGTPLAKRTRAGRSQRPNIPQLDGADDGRPAGGRRAAPARKRTVSAAKSSRPAAAAAASEEEADSDSVDSEADSDFECVPKKKAVTARRTAAAPKPKPKAKAAVDRVKETHGRIDRRLLSTDVDEEDAPGKTAPASKAGMNLWLEVFSEAQEQWLCVDLFKMKVACVDTIRAAATKPLSYVLAWNGDGTVRDVSARYCTNWNTTTRRQRCDAGWLDAALRAYRPRATFATRTEDLELERLTAREPLPTTIGEFKNHPLYALQRHLLKFEGLYPADAPPLGFVRGEPVYARECVHTLHSRDIWLKSALVVRPGETAYKVVKARPRWDRQTNKCLEPQPLEIFGHWQTQPYDPPTAENGVVPRNAYGNVELFKPEMLPKKTVHLQLPGLNRTCKRMKIDCAQAVTGFDFHSGSCHPTFDGFVVCAEFAEQVEAQYWLDQEEAQRKEVDKYEARVYGNWKKLIRGLMIRERLQKKYKFAGDGDDGVAVPAEEKKAPRGRRK